MKTYIKVHMKLLFGQENTNFKLNFVLNKKKYWAQHIFPLMCLRCRLLRSNVLGRMRLSRRRSQTIDECVARYVTLLRFSSLIESPTVCDAIIAYLTYPYISQSLGGECFVFFWIERDMYFDKENLACISVYLKFPFSILCW